MSLSDNNYRDSWGLVIIKFGIGFIGGVLATLIVLSEF